MVPIEKAILSSGEEMTDTEVGPDLCLLAEKRSSLICFMLYNKLTDEVLASGSYKYARSAIKKIESVVARLVDAKSADCQQHEPKVQECSKALTELTADAGGWTVEYASVSRLRIGEAITRFAVTRQMDGSYEGTFRIGNAEFVGEFKTEQEAKYNIIRLARSFEPFAA
ncbi:hypothetical protein [Roseibium sp.]|uniref:hypothetical protein n=1 Tax=Roseibium sp. TaxID=1936156 RepID=UPI0039EE75D9